MKVSAHPASWNLAYHVLDQHPPGSITGQRDALETLDTIAEKAPPQDPHPDPFRPWTEEQRAEVEERLGKSLNPLLRVEVDLRDPKHVKVLKVALEAYLNGKCPPQQARALLPVLDGLDAK